MRVSMVSNGHRIVVQTNTYFSPEETVLYDGREVSRRRSWLNSKHEFIVTEDGKAARYEVEIKLDLWYGGVKVTLRRNDEVVLTVN